MRRRDIIKGIAGSAAAWPLTARAQTQEMPTIGFLNPSVGDTLADRLRGFRRGLGQAGFVEGENVAVAYRWADNHDDHLPQLARTLAGRRVAVIAATGGTNAALAAKAATTTIPIIFAVPGDPVRLGLVSSIARPNGNLTGVNFLSNELTTKRFELLHELTPTATHIAVFIDPSNAVNAESILKEIRPAAERLGVQLRVFNVGTSDEINAAFASFEHDRPDALFVGNDQFFGSRRVQLANLASYYRLPAAFSADQIAEAGGLMSYSTDVTEAWRQVGEYAGRILKGAKPADLPVVQMNKFKFVINLQTARMLGITVPQPLLVSADEVIE
jgi:putative ABC transport system substrate-binding protein